jgi:hypothetical protein
MFEFSGKDDALCKDYYVQRYKSDGTTTDGNLIKLDDFKLKASEGEKVDSSFNFYFRLGGETSPDTSNWSALFTASVTLCGDEEIKA